MNKNIELKARFPDLTVARAKAESIGAKFNATLNQTDTYFRAHSGRLKLREINGGQAELIAYHRSNAVESRESSYTIIPIAEPALLKQALTVTLGVRQIVTKQRDLWLWKNVRIHLDQVKGLGSFIEFEAVVSDEFNEEVSAKNVAELCAHLSIREQDLIGQSYSDLLGQKIADV